MILAGEPLIVLGPLEVGQDLAIAPAGAALLVGPGVVVGGIAAGVDLGVDRGAAADHLGLGVPEHPVVQMLRHGRPAPAGDALGHLGEAGGHVEERVPVGAAGLEQEDLDGGVGAQPVGQHAARRPGAGDDVVVGHEASQVTVAGCRARRRRRSRCPSRSRTRRGRGPPPPGRRPAVHPSAGPAPGRRRSCDRVRDPGGHVGADDARPHVEHGDAFGARRSASPLPTWRARPWRCSSRGARAKRGRR